MITKEQINRVVKELRRDVDHTVLLEALGLAAVENCSESAYVRCYEREAPSRGYCIQCAAKMILTRFPEGPWFQYIKKGKA